MTPAVRAIAITVLLLPFLTGALPAQEQAVCAVCGPREGSGFEAVEATATLEGKEYFFCSLDCKIEFLRDPKSFLFTDVGSPAPPFALETFDGEVVTLSALEGKVVLLDFWATYCRPCLEALPELEALHRRWADRGFTVVGVTVDDRAELVERATSRAGVSYPIVKATPEVWNAYRVTALPALVLVDRDGTILRRFGGEADETIMQTEIERAVTK